MGTAWAQAPPRVVGMGLPGKSILGHIVATGTQPTPVSGVTVPQPSGGLPANSKLHYLRRDMEEVMAFKSLKNRNDTLVCLPFYYNTLHFALPTHGNNPVLL